jgi:hypothetical protein
MARQDGDALHEDVGFDEPKKIHGRKWHLLVDTLGLDDSVAQ